MAKKPIKFSGKKRKLSSTEKKAQAGLSLDMQNQKRYNPEKRFYTSDGRYGERGKPPAYGAYEALKATGYSKDQIKSRLKKKKKS